MSTLFFAVWLTTGLLFDSDKLHSFIQGHVAYRVCKIQKIVYGKSHKKRDLIAYIVPGRISSYIAVTGSIHGDEKAGAVVVTQLLLNLCVLKNTQPHGVILIPVLNPDGFARPRRGRGNARYVDLNRDAFTSSQPETQAVKRFLLQYTLVRFVDIHMTGNVILTPRRWTRAYAASLKFAERIRALGLRWRIRDGEPTGMLYSWMSERGVPSVLIEIGGRVGDWFLYDMPNMYRLIDAPTLALFALLRLKHENGYLLRSGTARFRLMKFEKNYKSSNLKSFFSK